MVLFETLFETKLPLIFLHTTRRKSSLAFFLNTWASQKFCNILVVREAQLGTSVRFCQSREGDGPYSTMRCQARLILSECYTLICFYSLENGLGIRDFRPSQACMIVEILATRAKFLESSGYSNLINCTITINVFGCFGRVMAQFELVSISFRIRRHCTPSVWLSNPTPSEAMYNMSAHQLARYYQPQ